MKNTGKFGIDKIHLSIPNDTVTIGTIVTAEVELTTHSEDVKYAWYIYHNGKIIEKIMYSSGTQKCNLAINKLGTWKFKAFILSSEGEKVAKYSQEITCVKKKSKALEDFPERIISYENLNSLNVDTELPTLYTIEKDDSIYEYLVKRDKTSSNLTVIGSGTYDPNRYQLPVFQRFTWMNEIEGNVIYYNDPTLYLGDIRVGWGQGSSKEFPLSVIAETVKTFARKMNINNNQILFYGSSSGGFMSLVLGGYVKGASVLVNNPITIVSNSKYFNKFFSNIGEIAYKGYSLEKMKREFRERQDIRMLYKMLNYVPNIYCLVNAASEYDMEKHFKPMINEYNKLLDHPSNNELITHLYWDEEAQHNPIDKEETLKYINKVRRMWCVSKK